MTTKDDRETERAKLISAARSVIRRSGYSEANITDILNTAGVSTRAFYRHFASKVEILYEIARLEGAATLQHVTNRVDSETTAPGRVSAWIAAMLELAFNPRLSRNVAMFRSPAVQSALALQPDAWTPAALIHVLAESISKGVEDGSIDSTSPAGDASVIYDVVYGLVMRLDDGLVQMTELEARQYVARFCLAPIGLHWVTEKRSE